MTKRSAYLDKSGAPLRKTPDLIPFSAWLVIMLTTAERFSFYGLSAPLMNFIQNHRNNDHLAGGLGWGQVVAVQVTNGFYILMQLAAIGGAVLADKSLGRYNLLCASFSIYVLGSGFLVLSSIPAVLEHGAASPLFIIALICIAIGMSGANGSITTFVGEQYTKPGGEIIITASKEAVITDRELTLESIYNFYYWGINVGGLSGIAKTLLEKHFDFWVAFLLPLCTLSFSTALLIFGKRHFSTTAVESSALPNALQAAWLGIRNGFCMDPAKPEYQAQRGRTVNWTPTFIEEMKRALIACRMLCLWPVLYICRGQLSTNLVTQAGQMQTPGVPNDMMYNANPIVIIICLPVLDRILLLMLRHRGLAPTATVRIAIGFLLEAAAMGAAAGTQALLYRTGPCYKSPLRCGDNNTPNSVSIFVQLPIYVLEAFPEMLCTPVEFELAFTMAPKSMKSVFQATFNMVNILGSMLSITISPAYRDPYMTWVYATLAIAMVLAAILFQVRYGKFRSSEIVDSEAVSVAGTLVNEKHAEV